MAIKLVDKPGVQAPNAAYPFGRPKDNSGSNDGMPVNVLTHGDFHQFFAKMMDAAAITYNGLPDNATDGFQYFIALVKVIRTSITYIDISNSVSIDSAFSTVIKNIRQFDDGTVDVEITLTYTGSIASGSLICTGLPNKKLFAIAARVSGGLSVQYVNLIKNNLSHPDRLYCDDSLPNLGTSNVIGFTFTYKKD